KQRNSGEFRAGSNQHAGQRVAADYYLEPAIIIGNESVGGLAAGMGGLMSGFAGAVAGSLQSKQSVVTMTMFDIRSGVQLSVSEGNATATNFGAALGALTGSAAGGMGGFSRTPEGKATVALPAVRPRTWRPWRHSWIPTTTWSSPCVTTRLRKFRAFWGAVLS